MTGYYDYVLGIIPLALFGLSAALGAAGLSLTTAVPLGAGLAMLVVGHALFVNGPVDAAGVDVAPAQTRTSQATQTPPVNAD